MESATATADRARPTRSWIAGLLPLAVLAAAIATFVLLDAPGLERSGPPLEEVTAGSVELQPGEIVVNVRNEGPDPVTISQAIVNDGFASFSASDRELGRLDSGTVTIEYPWIEGEAYEVALLTGTGGTVEASVEVAAETPEADAGFYGLMGLIGLYVGIIPVAIGMLWLPWLRSIDPRWVRFLLALTVGLLVFLGIDALLEGAEFAGAGVQAFGGAALVYLGAVVAYLALAGIEGAIRARGERREGGAAAAGGMRLAFLVALGIGLHNLGEGLAIGSAYAVGALGLGAALIVGFAIHNTTEGLAIVAPVSSARPSLGRLAGLGVLAGAPAILGAWIGASAFDTSLAAFMLGLGAGAIARVVVQLLPAIRSERDGRLLDGLTATGLLAGLALMYATGLLITV